MFFTRLKIIIFAAVVLFGFSYFLLFRVDSYVKAQALSSMSSQIRSVAEYAFAQGNITDSGPAHREIVNMLKKQHNVSDVWVSKSDELVRDLAESMGRVRKRDTPRDEVERRTYATKTIESSLTPAANSINTLLGPIGDATGRVSAPIITTEYCIGCHPTLKAGDVLGSMNAQFTINDSIMSIFNAMKLELGAIILVVSLAFMFIMLFSISSFTKLVYSIKDGIQSAIEGNFTNRVKVRGVGIFNETTKLTNRLLEVLDKSISSIDTKIGSIFIYKKNLYSKNPLLRVAELIAELTNLFLFKNKIEVATTNREVYKELQVVIAKYIRYKYLIFAELINGEIVSGYKIEDDTEMKITVGDVKSTEKRLENENPNVLFDDEKGCLFISTSIETLNVIDLRVTIAENIVLYYAIVMNSKKEMLEKEASVSRIYNYIREAKPIIKNIILVKSIEEASYSDPLTKSYNRLYLEKYSKMIPAKLQKFINFGVLMLDIDHFKRVNDTYGHNVGDAGIVMLTETIKKIIKPSDKLFRYGGEEFVVILEGYDDTETARTAEKIRNAFAIAKKCSLMELHFQKSVSIGYSLMPDFSNDIWECINQADLALYEAKETGRNRVIKYSPDLKAKKEEKDRREAAQKAAQQNPSVENAPDDDDDFLESLKLNS